MAPRAFWLDWRPSASLSMTRSGNRITQVNDSVGNSSWTYTYGDGGLLTYDGRQGTNLAWNVLGQTSGAGTRKRSFLAGGALYQEAFGTGNRIRQGSYVYRKKMSA